MNDMLSKTSSHQGTVHESDVIADPCLSLKIFIAFIKRHNEGLGTITRAHTMFSYKSKALVTAKELLRRLPKNDK